MGSFEDVSSEGSFAEDERKLVELWKKLKAFERSVSQPAGAKNFIFYELPVNHSPHFAPVLHPTLETGVEAIVVAALAWLAPGIS